ncbi:MAG TPA: type II secretion system protein [Candidatus Saccharimonadales bacterium]|nr:type II secretion system protein [Candidatus Saccharimonadales bacterium]
MKQPDQRGFSIVETLLVLVIIGALSFVGYYVQHARKNADVSLDAATNSARSASTQSTSTEPGTTTSGHSNGSSGTPSGYGKTPVAVATNTSVTPNNNKDLQAALANSDPNDSQSQQSMNDASSALSTY